MDQLYVVVELQKNGNQMGNVVTSHNTLQDAHYKFHTVAAAAAISNVEKHSVVLLNDDGFSIERVTYEHEQNQ